MIGDLGFTGVYHKLQSSSGSTRVIQVPISARGAFKITENESPRPQDRVFFNYNYFNNVHALGGGEAVPGFDLHRETVGFEKTFFEGNASFGVRLPIFVKDGSGGGVAADGIGDLSFVMKYAFINDNQSGNVLSGGLVVTAPTGRDQLASVGADIHPTLLQPYVGFIYNMDRFYAQGFSSLIVPTDSRDTTFWANDLGVGYRCFQASDDRCITSLTPTLEAHLNTPLDNRSSSGTIFFPDQMVITGGVHLGICNRAFLTLGAAVPVTGPKPFDIEGVAQFNFTF
jgi:hypothetical protein